MSGSRILSLPLDPGEGSKSVTQEPKGGRSNSSPTSGLNYEKTGQKLAKKPATVVRVDEGPIRHTSFGP